MRHTRDECDNSIKIFTDWHRANNANVHWSMPVASALWTSFTAPDQDIRDNPRASLAQAFLMAFIKFRTSRTYWEQQQRSNSQLQGRDHLFRQRVAGRRGTGRGEEDVATQATSDATPDFLGVKADLGQKAEFARLVSEVVNGMGRLDVVFLNGGWTAVMNLNDLEDNPDEDVWDRCWNISIKSNL
ncbi:uncharacterized protein L3040_006035 [Drepanopeziza brunnea f. sp. 'multigermtubi']|uniref:uncharacterized protein n=1 Tax=Drepanopeziza brunnea f. sp. 'multigermtubi' TaxID=698441 RepID=UPI00239EA96A|nr:hypothetical protein L3040_006035 [Drepanopeziza brunnea f. sp. 'multigermtubi']